MDKSLVIIGASYLQLPLVKKAKELGYRTIVFAWNDGVVGQEYMDEFYPISIREIDEIYDIIKDKNVCGVCSIASDLANITVHTLARKLGLPCNSEKCIDISTNKYLMRDAFYKGNISCPRYKKVSSVSDIIDFDLPVIVKPTDRSGSRAIYKVEDIKDLKPAIKNAIEQSFEKCAIVESYIEGNEYSAECITENGRHTLLAVTKKFTTEAPNFIEIGHVEKSDIEDIDIVKNEIFKALDSLGVTMGASHSEFKWDKDKKELKVIEIGSRMGGDFIGAKLVEYSTGYDFVKMVIDSAVGNPLDYTKKDKVAEYVAIRYILSNKDKDIVLARQDSIIESDIPTTINDSDKVVDSGTRHGYAIMKFDSIEKVLKMFD